MKFLEKLIPQKKDGSDVISVDLEIYQKRLEEKYRILCTNQNGWLEIEHKTTRHLDEIQYHVSIYKSHEVKTQFEVISIQQVKNGTIIGLIRAYYQQNSSETFPVNLPLVEYTKTDSRYRRKGYAVSRLQVLNDIAQEEWNEPLRSSSLISPIAKEVWRRLVKKKLAKSTTIDDVTIYYFANANDSSTA
jgi:hypothetical protein